MLGELNRSPPVIRASNRLLAALQRNCNSDRAVMFRTITLLRHLGTRGVRLKVRFSRINLETVLRRSQTNNRGALGASEKIVARGTGLRSSAERMTGPRVWGPARVGVARRKGYGRAEHRHEKISAPRSGIGGASESPIVSRRRRIRWFSVTRVYSDGLMLSAPPVNRRAASGQNAPLDQTAKSGGRQAWRARPGVFCD